MKKISIGSKQITLEDVALVASGESQIDFNSQARAKVTKGHATVARLIADHSKAHYGINTGFGNLKNFRISSDQLAELQVNFIRSHAVGVGDSLSRETVRAMMFLRAETLALGHSGVRPEVIEMIISMLNADLIPVIPCQGSVGASGDLAPLSHLALGMMGEGDVTWKGKRESAARALAEAEIEKIIPGPKEALALVNGTQFIGAIGILSLLRAENAVCHADIAAAMTLEADMGSPRAFDPKVHVLRPHPGQAVSAKNLIRLTSDSEIYDSHRDCEKVQDAYSIRCAPQVHGAARDALVYVRGALEREIQSVTDNPILFPETNEAISAGNFHGQPLALALDLMAVALTSVASISERRTARLLNPQLSGLPPGLTNEPGLNSGLMMLQVTAASLVSECKTLAHPASVDSIPTWADQEDHVSMGAFAARKGEEVVTALERVIAIELITAAQGLEFRKPLRPAKAVEATYKTIRQIVAPLKGDRYLAPEIEMVRELIVSKKLIRVAGEAVGEIQ